MNFQVERLRRLPQRPGETWQGGIFKIPTWVEEGADERPRRPWVAGWVSLKTRLIHMSEPRTDEPEPLDAALNALTDFACNEQLAGYRPAKLQVKDPGQAEYLRQMLADVKIEVERRDKLLVFEQVFADMMEHVAEYPLPPDALDARGVTVESMRAFADGAARFYEAQPWEYLSSEDLIEIESPVAESGLRYTTVVGARGDAFGLRFFRSHEEFERLLDDPRTAWVAMGARWVVLFGPITDLPFGDVDLWEEHKLPVADAEAYPLAVRYDPGGKDRRPGPDTVAFLEGLLHVLAEVTEQEIDTGRWTRQVDTAKGQMVFTLCLADLAESQGQQSGRHGARRALAFNPLATERVLTDLEHVLEGKDFESTEQVQAFLQENYEGRRLDELEPTTPLQRAQDLVCQAYDALGRRQVQLARQALEICPDCADAHILLAERTSDPGRQLQHYSEAMASAERTLGPRVFEEDAGHFWGAVRTRPYMRARFGLADCLERLGRREEAVEHYRELLRLNPNDNQGVRFSLWPCLLMLHQDDEVNKLLRQHKDDKGRCNWDYTCALLSFRQKGDTATARKHLRQALANNEAVADFLLGDEPFPALPAAGYELGSEQEALVCASLLVEAWYETPDAIDWLEEVVQQRK